MWDSANITSSIFQSCTVRVGGSQTALLPSGPVTRPHVRPTHLRAVNSAAEPGQSSRLGAARRTLNLDHIPTIDHDGLKDLLISMGTEQTLMVWGPPGIGKSEIVAQFGLELGMPVSVLLGSQMSPEDLAVPLIDPQTYTTRMCPPDTLMRPEASVIFIDELNGAEPDVMRAFFPLINERRVGSHFFPQGSVVVCAGNPTAHNSVARPVPAPLMNRMYHVQLKVSSTRGWLTWAGANGVHPLITDFIGETGLRSLIGPPGDDDQLSPTPRGWAIASRALYGWNVDRMENAGSPAHARQMQAIVQDAVARKEAEEFGAWLTRRAQDVSLQAVLRGEQKPPVQRAAPSGGRRAW